MKELTSNNEIENFVQRGGKIQVINPDAVKKYNMAKSRFNDANIKNTKTFKKLIENGHSVAEAKKIMKTENYLAAIACDYK